jgi:hypothetical protein
MLLVADTYNHRIKAVDPGARSVRSMLGTGKPGASKDGKPAFFEPGGVSVAGDLLFVADTNNHRVVRVDLKTGAWCEVSFEGLRPPADDSVQAVAVRPLEPLHLLPRGDIELMLDIQFPGDGKLSPDAPWSVRVTSNGATLTQQSGKSDVLPIRITIPSGAWPTDGDWEVSAALAYCSTADNGLCVPLNLAWHLPVRRDGSESRIVLRNV